MFGATAVITEPIVLQQTGELWEAVRIAVETIFTPRNALFLLAGVLLGLLMGALPGLGGPVALALLIPLTYPLGVNVSIMILAATLGGVAFGGSVTAILFNTPGDAPNAATLLDGYPLARQGRATEALSTSAIASASGAILGLFLFLASVPIVRQFALLFHSVDIFWLAVFGLVTVAVVSRGGIAANLVAGGVGLLLASHGFNQVTGTARFTWGTTYLRDGIQLIPLLIGLFAVAEMLRLASERTTVSSVDIGSGGTLAGAKIVFENRLVFLQSSIVGWLIGVVPGAGGTVANFVAYLQAQNISSDPESFGTGNVRGVIASEAANDAKDGGSMIPTLGLGIPGSASTAVLLGAFVVNGVIPGPQLFQENLQLVFIVIFGLLFSNVLTSAIGILLARLGDDARPDHSLCRAARSVRQPRQLRRRDRDGRFRRDRVLYAQIQRVTDPGRHRVRAGSDRRAKFPPQPPDLSGGVFDLPRAPRLDRAHRRDSRGAFAPVRQIRPPATKRRGIDSSQRTRRTTTTRSKRSNPDFPNYA